MFRRSFMQLAALPLIPSLSRFFGKEKLDYYKTKIIDYTDASLDPIASGVIYRRVLVTDRFNSSYVSMANLEEDGILTVHRYTDLKHPYFQKMTFHKDWKVIQYDEYGMFIKTLTKKDFLKKGCAEKAELE